VLIRHEDGQAAHARHYTKTNKDENEPKFAAEEVERTKVAELRMQVANQGHRNLLCTPIPLALHIAKPISE
jgi:hypothetical protein